MIISKILKKTSSINSLQTNKLKSALKDITNVKSSSHRLVRHPASEKMTGKLKKNLLHYIINIITTNTNTFINVTNVKGDPIIDLKAGSLNLRKRQKKTQPFALIKILKLLLLKSPFLHNKIVSIHFKNVKLYYESMIIQMLKEVLFIKSIKSYNLSPHNGCRPKKLKRFKKRTKSMKE